MAAILASRSGEPVARKPVGPPPLALRLAAMLAVPLLLYALVATGQKALDNYRLSQQAAALRGEVHDLRERNIQLQKEIVQARTDSAVEATAREQLGLVKPGDHAVVLVPSTRQEETAQPSPPPRAPDPPTWQQWWNTFFGVAPGR